MEQFVTILIYIHAFLGGVGLISGAISIFAQKGRKPHKRFGKVFSIAMLSSSALSLVVARMPGHENLFLFLIGLFTIYMVLAGNRALTFKPELKSKANFLDQAISGTMLAASVIMIGIGVYGLLALGGKNVLFLFFGGFGLFLSLGDFRVFKTFQTNKNAWLISHIGRMVGAMIASVTAFMVAGLNLTSLVFWITPTLIGTFYISYWIRKIKLKEKTELAKPAIELSE